MKLGNQSAAVSVHGVQKVAAFQLGDLSKLFRILSSNLYQDKIGSVVREIATNGMDSHTAAGKPDTPIEINLPNRLEGTFSVTDYGTGMSHEEVLRLYTTYGASSKDQSDDQVGAYGIGAKSPFAYTDSFTITTTKDGVKNTYGAYIDESNCPNIAVLSTCDTDEGDGTCVSIPVQYNDFEEFAEAAVKQLMLFNPRPIFSGRDVSFPNITQIDDAVSLVKGYAGIKIDQGGVLYPLDMRMKGIKNILDVNGASIDIEDMIGDMVIIKVPIGSVDIPPSREGLEYTQKTLSKVNEMLRTLPDRFAKFAESVIGTIDSKEAWLNALKAVESDGTLNTLNRFGVITAIGKSPHKPDFWHNIWNANDPFEFRIPASEQNFHTRTFSLYTIRTYANGVGALVWEDSSLKNKKGRNLALANSAKKPQYCFSFTPQLIKDPNWKYDPKIHKSRGDAPAILSCTKQQMKDFCEFVGLEFIDLADFEPEKQAATKAEKRDIFTYSNFWSQPSKPVKDFDFSEENYYVTGFRFKLEDEPVDLRMIMRSKIIREVLFKLLGTDQIYVIRGQSKIRAAREESNCILLNDVLYPGSDIYNKLTEHTKLIKRYANITSLISVIENEFDTSRSSPAFVTVWYKPWYDRVLARKYKKKIVETYEYAKALADDLRDRIDAKYGMTPDSVDESFGAVWTGKAINKWLKRVVGVDLGLYNDKVTLQRFIAYMENEDPSTLDGIVEKLLDYSC